ncbi:hypothetical protein [uncultured Rikenella sp.]|uniref:hypothetical protein n=1 Tax=uncultured Rikenella sp. TaxID=368003 RepID=UPI0025D1C672|nr:hypothetical protein [uncultured Rikenella sp.]
MPAPGFRHRDTGALNYVGSYGYSWSSTSYGSGDHYRGMYLNFGTVGISTSYADYRSFGFQLRCLSE